MRSLTACHRKLSSAADRDARRLFWDSGGLMKYSEFLQISPHGYVSPLADRHGERHGSQAAKNLVMDFFSKGFQAELFSSTIHTQGPKQSPKTQANECHT